MKVSLTDEALSDLTEAADWYIDESAPHVAEDLKDEVSHELTTLSHMPLIGRPADQGVRLWRLGRFPYSLVYRIEGDEAWVIAVAHHSRRPGYWKARL